MTGKQAGILVFILASALVGFIHSEVLLGLNETLFHVEGDGLKNYFNFLYHLTHDSQYSTFEGMNYPYGETLFMVDAHPLYVNLLKFFSENIYDIRPYGVGILNSTMLASVPVCALFLFLILRNYGVSPELSVPGALGITFLASNALLWEYGHYALSYACFFPISWYLLLWYRGSSRKKFWSVVIMTNTLCWFYIHNYLGLIVLGFNAAYLILEALLNKKFSKDLAVSLTLQVLVPIAFVFSVLTISDDHSGRIEMPFRPEYAGSLYTVLFTKHTYFEHLYNLLFDLSPMESQTWSLVGTYVGFSTNLILLSMAVILLTRLFRAKKAVFDRSQWAMFLSAVLLLMFSMAIPFKYGMEYLLPSLLKQFIGLGRFGWPFFFLATGFSLVFLVRILPGRWGKILFVGSSILLLTEGISMHRSLTEAITRHTNLFHDQAEDLNGLQGFDSIDFSKFQAILPLPYYHKYISLHSFPGSLKSEKASMALSLQTGLPLMSAILSRPSVSESKRITEVFLPSNFNKPLINDLDERPLLILYTGEKLTDLEKDLLNRSELVWSSDSLHIMSLSLDSLETEDHPEVAEFIVNSDSMVQKGEHFTLDSVKYLSDSFDQYVSPKEYRGEGAKALKKNEFHVVFISQPGELEVGLDYELSFWYYNDIYEQSFTTCWIDVKNSRDSIIYNHYFDPVTANVFDGNWHLNRLNFRLENEGDYVLLCSQGVELFGDTIYFDEVLVRPIDTDVFSPLILGGELKSVIKNNISFEASP